jgi:plastocyanin
MKGTLTDNKTMPSDKTSNDTSAASGNKTIILNVAEVGDEEQYRWMDGSGAENPTLNIMANRDYIIKISNPTDEEHQLIIDSKADGKLSEIAKSEEIKPQSKNIELNFKTDQVGELGYHCKYHPDMMNGTINLTQ